MKRPGKCIGKKAFANRLDAEVQVIRNYIFKRHIYGIYECPTCLDFHTTHLYDNRTSNLRIACERTKVKYWKKRVIVSKELADDWLYRKMLRYCGAEQIKPVKPSKPIPRTHIQTIISRAYNLMYTHLGISKPKTTLVGVLPLEEQRRLLRTLTTS